MTCVELEWGKGVVIFFFFFVRMLLVSYLRKYRFFIKVFEWRYLGSEGSCEEERDWLGGFEILIVNFFVDCRVLVV